MALKKIPPTVGLNSTVSLVAKIQQNALELVLWDLGGKAGIRNIWTNYYAEAQTVLFLIDGVDRSRFAEAKEVLAGLFENEELRTKPIHLLINKHDQDGCASIGFVREFFELVKEENRECSVYHISALTQ
jgi:GTPase SAR1 family protein